MSSNRKSGRGGSGKKTVGSGAKPGSKVVRALQVKEVEEEENVAVTTPKRGKKVKEEAEAAGDSGEGEEIGEEVGRKRVEKYEESTSRSRSREHRTGRRDSRSRTKSRSRSRSRERRETRSRSRTKRKMYEKKKDSRKRKQRRSYSSDSSESENEKSLETAKDIENEAKSITTNIRTTTREAEVRRLLLVKWTVTKMQEKMGKTGHVGEEDMVRLVAAVQEVTNAMVKGLITFDRDQISLPITKVKTLEESIVKKVGNVGRGFEKVAEEMIPVQANPNRPPVGGSYIYGGADGVNAGGGPSTRLNTRYAVEKAEKQRLEAEQKQETMKLQTMLSTFLSSANNINAGNNRGVGVEQQVAAAVTQQTNGQNFQNFQAFQPAAARPPRGCYTCGSFGHVQWQCPNRLMQQGTGGGSVVAAAAGAVGVATTQANQVRTKKRNREGIGIDKAQRCEDSDPNLLSSQKLMQNEMYMSDVFSNRQDKEKGKNKNENKERECECGGCGECTMEIDTMQKEQKEKITVAKEKKAQEIEEKTNKLYAELDSLVIQKENIQLTKNLIQKLNDWEDEWTWRTQAQGTGEERGEREMIEVQGEPAKAEKRLREKINGEGNVRKKMYTRKEQMGKQCTFCRRKGHEIGTCMIRPRVEERKGEETELQTRKREFVINLCGRNDQPTREERKKEENESKLEAVQRIMERGKEANRSNPWMDSEKRRDKLRKQLGYWWAIGADKSVIMWIGFGIKLYFEKEPERTRFNNHRSYYEHIEHVDKEHEEHIKDGSFRIARAEEIKIGNPLQVEVNAKGKKRMCSDDRFVNAHMADYEFTQETLNKHVAMIISKNAMMVTTDVEKAYYQVPLHKDSQGYCAWKHRDRWIVPTIGVFGLGVMPFIFTKIMKVQLGYMRALEIKGTNCIDDNLWTGEEGEMKEIVEIVRMVFGNTGWNFNSKCVFDPSKIVVYNGMILDSEKYEIRAPGEKIEAARRLAWNIWYAARDGKEIEIKKLMKIAGRLQSIKLAVEGVQVWTRGIYAEIAQAQERYEQRLPKDAKTRLGERALEDINFWAYRLGKQNGLPIRDNKEDVHMTVRVDASDVGWGAHKVGEGKGNGVEGELTKEVIGSSSTAREIRGLMEAAGELEKKEEKGWRGKKVRIEMDSYPAIRNLINGGGAIEELNGLVKEWWIWCKIKQVVPVYKWIPREENGEADELSKKKAECYKVRQEKEIEIRRWLDSKGEPGNAEKEWERTRIQAPRADNIGVRIEEMIRSKRPTCIIVPVWTASPWWPYLCKHSVHKMRIGRIEQVLEEKGRNIENTKHQMEAHVIGETGK